LWIHIRSLTPALCLCIEIERIFLDIYGSILGQSMSIDELFVKLESKLKQEVNLQKSMLQLQGALDMIFAIADKGDISILDETNI
jgi:hypothetical protein